LVQRRNKEVVDVGGGVWNIVFHNFDQVRQIARPSKEEVQNYAEEESEFRVQSEMTLESSGNSKLPLIVHQLYRFMGIFGYLIH